MRGEEIGGTITDVGGTGKINTSESGSKRMRAVRNEGEGPGQKVGGNKSNGGCSQK